MRLLSIITIISFCMCAYSIDYYAYEVENAPVIDGTFGSGEWNQAIVDMVCPDILNSPNEGFVVVGAFGGPAESDASAQVFILWDENYLYIGINVTDDDKKYLSYSPGPYNSQDAFQMCFNFLNRSGVSFNGSDPQSDTSIWDFVADTADDTGADIFAHGKIFDDKSQIQIAATVNSTGYIIEAAIPWSQIDAGYSPSVGDEHGVGLILMDFDASYLNALFTDFGNGSNTIGQPSTWNTLNLVSVDGCGVLPFSSGDVNKDCAVTLEDFAILAVDWTLCTDPTNTECLDLRQF